MPPRELRQFLLENLSSNNIPHSGRSLYVHLEGTYRLLHEWGNDEYLCNAGLFHSIYGTWHFKTVAFPITNREKIREIIGARAEHLVYLFCVTKRPSVFLQNIGNPTIGLFDHFKGEVIPVGLGIFSDLLELEAANLLEQGGNTRKVLQQIQGCGVSTNANLALSQHLSHKRVASG